MTGREVVKKSINFSRPDRIPFDMPVSGPSDVFNVLRPRSRESIDPSGNIFIDHFGCQFEIIDNKTMGQATNFPIKDIKKLDEYPFPDPQDESLYSKLEHVLQKAGNNYVSVYFIWFTFFERMHFLHGFEQTLIDLYDEPSLIMELADKIIEYNITIIREIGQRFPGKVHGIAMSDDWGTQNSTLISPTLFKEFFLPRYKKLCGTIRDQGMEA